MKLIYYSYVEVEGKPWVCPAGIENIESKSDEYKKKFLLQAHNELEKAIIWKFPTINQNKIMYAISAHEDSESIRSIFGYDN